MNYVHVGKIFDSRHFMKECALLLNWTEFEKDLFMNICCDGGLISTANLLELFPKIKKVIAIDTRSTSKIYEHPKMEYHEADITKSSSLAAWKGKITKFISCYSFNGLESFDEAFENVFDLLVPNGTAALYFTLNTSYCTFLDEVIKKWLKLDGIPSYQGVPAVQKQNLDAKYFETLARKVGFDVVFCESFLQNMYFVTDAEFIAFFDVVCPRGLTTLLKEAFKRI